MFWCHLLERLTSRASGLGLGRERLLFPRFGGPKVLLNAIRTKLEFQKCRHFSMLVSKIFLSTRVQVIIGIGKTPNGLWNNVLEKIGRKMCVSCSFSFCASPRFGNKLSSRRCICLSRPNYSILSATGAHVGKHPRR